MKNRIKYLFLFLIVPVICFSCNSKHSRKKNNGNNDTIKITYGKVNTNLTCIKDATVKYCIYVPSNYDADKNTAVIFAFDPHGNGKLPVDLIKDDAERFGYIVVGSDFSKNGLDWQTNSKMIDILFDDIFLKFNIDKRRIYTMGFSGGSRVASLVAITKGGINGVIGCGAGFPGMNKPIENKFSYLGFVGNADFNMSEMNQLDKDLTNMGFKHYIEVFNGKHEWPTKSILSEAFIWMEFNAARDNFIARKDTLLINTLLRYQKQLETFNRNKDIYNEYQMYEKIISFFDQLTDISEYQKMLKEIEASSALNKIMKQKEQIAVRENKLQQTYSEAMITKDTTWWNKEMEKINKKTIDISNIQEVLLMKRTLSYLSLVAYMNSSGALNANKLEDASKYIKIYALVDPTNTDHYYFEACLNSLQGNTDKAFNALEKAISLGFNDKDRMLKDNMLNNLKGLTKYQEIIGKLSK